MSPVDLVTGGAGFIGSHLVRRLVTNGRSVRVVDDLSTGDRRRLAPVADVIEFLVADLATAELAPLLRDVRHIYHLAAVPSVPRSVADPERTHASVATATLRLLLAARDAEVERVIVSSSSSVYGETATLPKHERLALWPVSPYAVAKVAAESYARAFAALYGLRTVSLRYFNVFGPGQDPGSAYAAVIPVFIARALADEPLRINGDGHQTRDFTYVENVVEANIAAAGADAPPGAAYNVAAGDPRSILDLVAALERILGRRLRLEHSPGRAGDIVHSAADIGAARAELGWAPSIGFEDGLRLTVDWYRTA